MRGLSLPAIHKHIAVLEDAELVLRRKAGRTNYLALRRAPLLGLQDWLARYHVYWGSDEETLENYVEYLTRDDPQTREVAP
jgi:DNA-binding transcriptional ArsR family regulator